MSKITLKTVFESDEWTIIKITQGFGMHRIDARRKFRKADKQNFFSKWGRDAYLESLAKKNYKKALTDFSCYYY